MDTTEEAVEDERNSRQGMYLSESLSFDRIASEITPPSVPYVTSFCNSDSNGSSSNFVYPTSHSIFNDENLTDAEFLEEMNEHPHLLGNKRAHDEDGHDECLPPEDPANADSK